MAMVIQADSQPKSGGLVCGSTAACALFCNHQMNRVNSRNDLRSWWQHYKYRPGIVIIITYAQTFWPTTTKFDRVARVGYERVSRGSAKRHPKGPGPTVPQMFCDPYLRPYSLTQSDQIGCDNKYRGVTCSTGKPRPHSKGPSVPKIIGTMRAHIMRKATKLRMLIKLHVGNFLEDRPRMPMGDLFLVANFLVLQ